MTIEYRAATADEMGQLGWLTSYAYGGSFGDGPDNVPATANRPEWTLCAFDGARMVSSYGTIPFTMRANGNAVSLGGVTAVSTLPEYRRRGIVRQIVTRAFADMREQGQGLASLWASQAAIYQRYQYAQSSVLRHYHVDTTDVCFFDGDAGSHTVAREPLPDALDVCRDVYRSFIAGRTGYLHRARVLWMNNTLGEVAADGPVHIAISRDAAGTPSGYVVFTLRAGKLDHPARSQELKIRDFGWLSADAYRSLWSFLRRHDLVGRIVWDNAPLDDPAQELFEEPRLLNMQDREGTWLRVVDAEAALGGRGYEISDRITLALADDSLTPWNDGTYELETSPDGAVIKRSTATPEVRMTVKALSSLYTGFRTGRELARIGSIAGDNNAILKAERVFRIDGAPHCPDHF